MAYRAAWLGVEEVSGMAMKQVDERERLRLQIQAYEFYASLIDRAVGGASAPVMPKWDEARALEYRQLADELRARLARLEAEDKK
jgi:hypothetical protein